ncbi:PfaD family polyunsaturated fatty acid/polyketide biosynthesis protein [Rhodospirillum sp. A1_3_36]|uniref:PfaD family polyunsaturated fatty acid/polyketide biosynthesis protein n=1 Tax=Rhodospirillum sp. A1_3_36 TaxID=3391666 RepID=UPI0039A4F649
MTANPQQLRQDLLDLTRPCQWNGLQIPAFPPDKLGDPGFRSAHGVRFNYMAGAMANGISSVELVVAMGKAGYLGSFGAAGLDLSQIDAAIKELRQRLPSGPFAVNLIHHFDRPDQEMALVDLCLSRGVRSLEASAFTDLQPALVRFRAAGLRRAGDGSVQADTQLIVKLSNPSLALRMMQPAPLEMLRQLTAAGLITSEQAVLASEVPVAGDVTVEADSGGHTDSQQLTSLLPLILSIRNDVALNSGHFVRIGAAGGIGTPAAVAAAFGLGADYVVTGSINQACVEAGTSAIVKLHLAEMGTDDVVLAPSADMFELGAKVQVSKRATLFAFRARRLEALFQAHQSIDEIPALEKVKLERQIFQCSIDEVWGQVERYFQPRDPETLDCARRDPKHRMALIFRWYLGQSSAWAIAGRREADHQVWCGPAMGAFNHWTRGSAYADPTKRQVFEVAGGLMRGAAYLTRLSALRLAGVVVPPALAQLGPEDVIPQTQPASPVQSASAPAPQAPKRVGAPHIKRFLVQQIARQSGLSPEDIDIRAPFDSFGLNSIKALVVMAKLEEFLGLKLPQTLVWNYPSIDSLSKKLAENAL